MYIYHPPGNNSSSPTSPTSPGAMSADQSRRLHLSPQHQHSSSATRPPPPSHRHPTSAAPAPRSTTSSRPSNNRARRRSLPFAFTPLFHPNASSTSLVPSTAEGKPIPVDDTTAENRTSALRELNSNFPSRVHRYAQSTGAQSSTFSQPVIVRTYPGPPSRPVSANRGSIYAASAAGGSRLGTASGPSSVVRRIFPFSSSVGGGPGALSMARAKTKKEYDAADPMPRLPPMEAFTFKSFIESIEAQEDGHNINADLDRIAEICARSRYSLSNQYEVHVAPHGSGASFLASASRRQGPPGPTLQAVSSDDERRINRHRKRRSGGRRRSIAMGTLETIMSSSRSSDEDKSKKRSAAELADEVRGRAAQKQESGNTSPISSSQSESEELTPQDQQDGTKLTTKKSASFATAVIENTRQNRGSGDSTSPRSSTTLLHSEPAQPQTSTSHLETRTTDPLADQNSAPARSRDVSHAPPHRSEPVVPIEENKSQGLLSSISGWMPWSTSATSETDRSKLTKSHAEGSLRELLKTAGASADIKGKGVERPM